MRLFSYPLAALFAALPVACSNQSGAQPAKADPAKNVPVAVSQPSKDASKRTIELPGTLEAYEETPILARVSGYVAKVMVDSGDIVKGPRFDSQGQLLEPGQVLAAQAVPDMDEELKQKQALVTQATAEVAQAKAALDAAEAHVLTAKAQVRKAEAGRARAQANYDRWDAQFKQDEKAVQSKVLDVQSLEVTRNQFKAADAARQEIEAEVFSAEATARESEAQRNKSRSDVEAAKARVRVAEAEAGRQAALVAYAKLRAPYDGVVVRRNIHTGHYLQAAGVSATPLFVVARVDLFRIIVEVPESEALALPPGTPAKVRIASLKNQVFEGKVNRTSYALEAKTRTLRLQIDLANSSGTLRPGMYAHVSFTLDAGKADN